MQQQIRTRLKWFMGLTFLAILDTIYLTTIHFKPSANTLCKINDYLDCDIVNKSIYAELFDVPVAIWGMLTYILLFILGGMALKKRGPLSTKTLLWTLFAITTGGLLFSGYLTYIELFVLGAVCLFCVIQQIIILINFFLLLSIVTKPDRTFNS